jgi:hypothetical protein
MVIGKLVDIEELEGVKRWVHRDGFTDEFRCVIHRQEVNSTVDSTKVDNGKMRAAIILGIRLYLPETHVLVGLWAYEWIPLNKCTLILLVSMLKWKEEKNTSYFKATCPFKIWIWIDENAVVSCGTTSPWWCCPNVFTTHPVDATDIAGCVEHSHSRIEYADVAVKLQIWILQSVQKRYFRIGMKLSV